MEEADKEWLMIRIGEVLAYLGSPGQRAVKWL